MHPGRQDPGHHVVGHGPEARPIGQAARHEQPGGDAAHDVPASIHVTRPAECRARLADRVPDPVVEQRRDAGGGGPEKRRAGTLGREDPDDASSDVGGEARQASAPVDLRLNGRLWRRGNGLRVLG